MVHEEALALEYQSQAIPGVFSISYRTEKHWLPQQAQKSYFKIN